MKKLILSVFYYVLLLTGCNNKVQEKGKVQQIEIEDAFSEMDEEGMFLFMVTRDKYYYCQLICKMLDDTIEDHPMIVYNVKMDDPTTGNPCVDNDLLKTRLEKPGTTLHVYYTKDGMVKDDITGFDEENPLEFWGWVEKRNIENLKQKQEDGKAFISCFRMLLHPGTEGNQSHRLKAMRLALFCLGHYGFAYFQVGVG